MQHKTLIEQLECALTTAQPSQSADQDASHDVTHCRRVLINAEAIATELESATSSVNQRVLVAAAYLHDLVNVPKNASNRSAASRLSAQAAQPILVELGFSQADIDAIKHCIEAHSFSAEIEPMTLEAKIIQDADRLESLGALGVARTFYIAGKMNSQLFHAEDPFGKNRALNDKQFAIDHFKIKLLGLANSMKTTAGKRLAEQRIESMRVFLDAMAHELHTEHLW